MNATSLDIAVVREKFKVVAEEIGVGPDTVRRARPTAPNDAVEKRVGRDGKMRKMPTITRRADRRLDREAIA